MNPYYFLEESLWRSPHLIVLLITTLFAIIFFRYLVLAGLYQWWVTSSQPGKRVSDGKGIRREVKWSLISSAIFALLSVSVFYLYQEGYTRIYVDFDLYGVLYFIASIVVYLVLYETYYYWLHRWMHKPGIFRVIHKVHHESVDTSAFTSFSFHPLEALLQFIFLPVMVFVIPVHYYGLAVILILMTISAIINHAGLEIYPRKFYNHPVGKWLIGSTHHELHHKEFRSNFGLYFTFWDKWMGTESRRYVRKFETNTASRSRSPHHPSEDVRHM